MDIIDKIKAIIEERERKQKQQDDKRWCRCRDCQRWIGEDFKEVVINIKEIIEDYELEERLKKEEEDDGI